MSYWHNYFYIYILNPLLSSYHFIILLIRTPVQLSTYVRFVIHTSVDNSVRSSTLPLPSNTVRTTLSSQSPPLHTKDSIPEWHLWASGVSLPDCKDLEIVVKAVKVAELAKNKPLMAWQMLKWCFSSGVYRNFWDRREKIESEDWSSLAFFFLRRSERLPEVIIYFPDYLDGSVVK